MDKLSYRFILSNIVTAALLIVSLTFFREENTHIWEDQNILYGIVIYVALLGGIVFSVIKARDIGNRIRKKVSAFEIFFLFVIYIFAMGGNMMMLFMANNLLFGGHTRVPEIATNISIGVMLLAFFFLIAEPFLFSSLKKKPTSKRLLKVTDFFVGYYISVGIGSTWNALVFSGNLKISFEQSDFWAELFSLIVLAIMIILPFQRLFWYEVMAESERKDSWKVFGSVCLVLVAAIVPFFLKG